MADALSKTHSTLVSNWLVAFRYLKQCEETLTQCDGLIRQWLEDNNRPAWVSEDIADVPSEPALAAWKQSYSRTYRSKIEGQKSLAAAQQALAFFYDDNNTFGIFLAFVPHYVRTVK